MSKEIYVQIGIDDISWRNQQSIWSVSNSMRYLFANDLSLDLFIPAALNRPPEKTVYYIEQSDMLLFEISKLRSEFTDRVSFSVHGYNHGAGRLSVNDEFLHGHPDELREKLRKIEKLELLDSLVFRPPGWKISRAAVKLLEQHGYLTLCLLRRYKDQGMYDSFLEETSLNVHWCDYSPPDIEFDLKKIIETGRLDVTYHSATFLRNHLTMGNAQRLVKFTEQLKDMGHTIVPQLIRDIDFDTYGKN